MNKAQMVHEIEKFMEEQNFKRVKINGDRAYLFNEGVYLFSEDNNFAVLEYAKSIEDAEKYICEDIAAYNLKNISETEIIKLAKEDISRYVVKKTETVANDNGVSAMKLLTN